MFSPRGVIMLAHNEHEHEGSDGYKRTASRANALQGVQTESEILTPERR